MATFRVSAMAHVQVFTEADDADDAGYKVLTGQVDDPVEIMDVFDIEEVEEVTGGEEPEV